MTRSFIVEPSLKGYVAHAKNKDTERVLFYAETRTEAIAKAVAFSA